MLWLENLPTAIAVLLSAAAAVVALVVGLRRHFESARMRHLEAVLDRR
jgi:hypothetical protein